MVVVLFVFALMSMKMGMVVLNQDRDTIIDVAPGIQPGVFVSMSMLDADRVSDQEPGCGSHQDQAYPKGWHGKRPEDQKRKDDPQEGRDCIIGAGFCRPKMFLRFNVEVDTQAVSHKTKQHCEQDETSLRNCFSRNKSQDQRTQSGSDALDDDNVRTGSVGELAGEVVFEPPGGAGRQDQKRTC